MVSQLRVNINIISLLFVPYIIFKPFKKAYGQTGSGKTFSILGDGVNKGKSLKLRETYRKLGVVIRIIFKNRHRYAIKIEQSRRVLVFSDPFFLKS